MARPMNRERLEELMERAGLDEDVRETMRATNEGREVQPKQADAEPPHEEPQPESRPQHTRGHGPASQTRVSLGGF